MKKRFLLLWFAAVLATTAALILHLTLRFEVLRLGYEVPRKTASLAASQSLAEARELS